MTNYEKNEKWLQDHGFTLTRCEYGESVYDWVTDVNTKQGSQPDGFEIRAIIHAKNGNVYTVLVAGGIYI